MVQAGILQNVTNHNLERAKLACLSMAIAFCMLSFRQSLVSFPRNQSRNLKWQASTQLQLKPHKPLKTAKAPCLLLMLQNRSAHPRICS